MSAQAKHKRTSALKPWAEHSLRNLYITDSLMDVFVEDPVILHKPTQ